MRRIFGATLVAVGLCSITAWGASPGATRTVSRSLGGGGAYHSAGCDCASRIVMGQSCATGCDTTATCCPRPLRSLVAKIDCVLSQIFCNPCNPPCPRPRLCRPTCCQTVWSGYRSTQSCDVGCSTGNWSPLLESQTNPFVDDDLQVPPPVPKDARVMRPTPAQQVAKERPASPTRAVSQTTAPAPRAAQEPKLAAEPTPAAAPIPVASPAPVTKRAAQPAAKPQPSTAPKKPARLAATTPTTMPENQLRTVNHTAEAPAEASGNPLRRR